MPELLDILIAHSRDAIVIKEKRDGQDTPHIVAVNDAFTALTGYTAEDVVGQPYVLFGAVCPDKDVMARLDRAINDGAFFHEAHPCVRKDGTERSIDIYLLPVDPSLTDPDRPARWVTILREMPSGPAPDPHLHALVGGVDAVLWEAQPAPYRFTFLSPQVEALLGYPAEQWLTERALWRRAIHPEDRDRVLTACHRARRTGQDYETEFRMITAHGRTLWVQEIVRTVKDDKGKVVLLRGLLLDITHRRQMEDAAERDHEFLGAVLNTLEEGIAACDADGILTFFNGALRGWLGQTEQRVAADQWAARFQVFAPDGERRLRTEELPLWRALQGETVSDVELVIKPERAPQRTLRVSGQALHDAAGRTIGAVTVMQDITERQQMARRLEETEQYYRSLFDQNVDAVYSFSLDGSFISANRACEAITGFTVDELLGKPFLPLVVPEDRERALQDFARAVQGESCMDEITIVNKSGQRIDLNLTKVPIVIESAVVGVYGIAKDISVRRALEREREQLLAEAIERADRDPLTGLLNHRAFHKRLHEEADRSQRDGTPLAIAVIDMDNFKFFNDAYGHPVGDDVLRTVAGALSGVCRSYDTLARFGGDEFALLMPRVTREEASALQRRLSACLEGTSFQPEGQAAAVPLSLSVGMAIYPLDGTERLDVLAAADSRLRAAKSDSAQTEVVTRLRESLHQTDDGFTLLDALVTAVDNKDRYTRRHSEDVMTYSLEIALELGMDEPAQHIITVAALLHDLGKIGIPDAILRKPGPLTDEETKAIRHHPLMGAIIVSAVPGFQDTLDALRHHHERWDGAGYPFGLAGEAIPRMARLMAVADAYSAMTTDRPYRKGMEAMEALAILEAGAGAQWDPECVAAFLRVRKRRAASSTQLRFW